MLYYRYHPAVYKTKLCRAWLSEHSCKRVFCPFAHGDNELRMRGAAPKFFTSSNQYPDFQAPVPWNITDEPNSQSSYSSTASSARSNYKPQTQHFHESFYDSVEGMQPLGGLVLGSDGHLYLRVIPTRNWVNNSAVSQQLLQRKNKTWWKVSVVLISDVMVELLLEIFQYQVSLG